MGKKGSTWKILIGKTQGKTQLGRWEDIIKIDLAKNGIRGCHLY
jgi:hypothetical protein